MSLSLAAVYSRLGRRDRPRGAHDCPAVIVPRPRNGGSPVRRGGGHRASAELRSRCGARGCPGLLDICHRGPAARVGCCSPRPLSGRSRQSNSIQLSDPQFLGCSARWGLPSPGALPWVPAVRRRWSSSSANWCTSRLHRRLKRNRFGRARSLLQGSHHAGPSEIPTPAGLITTFPRPGRKPKG